MGTEIERKFLVRGEPWRNAVAGQRMRQGYLCFGPPVAVRVRIAGETATLNVKKATLDLTRDEFEYPVPREEAEAMLTGLCAGHPIDKTRYIVEHAGTRWEVDVFHGRNTGLVVAEVELETEDQEFEPPPWLGPEVSGDARYLNSHLAQTPHDTW